MKEKIEALMREADMIPKLSHVLVGFSGGADSSALLHYLMNRSRVHGTRVSAIHVNHGIRGETALRDEEHCRSVCQSWGIPLTVVRVDVPSLAKEQGIGLEEAARNARYEAFYRAMADDPTITAVATAHNAEDHAETVLFHLARGCGLAGLCGIPPVTPQNVIRPLLHCRREEIIAYCKGNTITYTEDETNGDTRYTRNHIRHRILPAFEEINPDYAGAMLRMGQTVAEDGIYLEQLAEEAYRTCVTGDAAKIHALTAMPPPILSRVLRRMYRKMGKGELAYVHVTALVEALHGVRTDLDIDLPGGIIFSLSRDVACFRQGEETSPFQYPLTLGENRFDRLNLTVYLSFDGKKPEYDENIYKLSTYQPINFDTIKNKVFIRSRQNGDRYVTKNMTKSVKRWMCDTHIPRWRRDAVPLFCDGAGIAYVRGMGLRDDLKTVEGCRILHLYLLEKDPY
ncbi:MAG: tRNA lysidine(34) synthetase TilS [Clostridia bacterium]|nr:tRNA lysidine(34) synthetase TilS [Clostridia bacterium]